MKTYIINTPILTDYGLWSFEGPMTIEDARKILQDDFISSVWHSASATFLSQLLNIEIPENRLQVKMQLYDSLTPIQPPEANRQPPPRQHSLSNKFVN